MNSSEDALTQTTSQTSVAATTTAGSANVSSIMAKVLAKHKISAPAVIATPPPAPIVAPVAVSVPKATPKPAAAAQKSTSEAEAKAS